MTIERSWLLPDADEDDAKPEGAMWYEGWLIPDTRLRAIKDAWNTWNARNKYQREEDIYGYWSEFEDLMDDTLTEEEDRR